MSPDPEFFKALERWFHRLDDLPPDEVEPSLAQLDVENRDLAVALRRMLEDRTEAANQFPDPMDCDTGMLGMSLAGYTLTRLLGEGGMGRVFLGERDGQGFHQKVAVKVLPAQWATGELRDRFQQECGILCRLEHPNLPRFIDGGVSEQGHSYLVMEYIDGAPIGEAVKSQSKERKAALFLQVCEAVRFAHRHLVIHRDIKPGNILVNTHGRVILLDFGIARVLDLEAKDDQTAVRRLTPRYASPEQLRGEPLTTGSDVYSLGAVLYEILNDRDFPGSASFERHFGTRDDLSAVLYKALSPELAERYESAGALADDLKRYLRGEPVEARAAGFAYHLKKLVVRYKWPVTFATVAVLSLIIGLGVAVREGQKAAKARDRAVIAQQQQTQVTNFLVGLFEGVDPESMGEAFSLDQLLERGQKQVALDLGDQPQLRARMHVVLADIFLKLKRPQDASDQASTFKTLVGTADEDPENWLLANEIQSEAMIHQERVDEGVRLLEEGVALAERQGDVRSLGTAFSLLGLAHTRAGRWDEAEQAFARAVATLSPCNTLPCRTSLVQTYLNQGARFLELGDIEQARDSYERADEVNREDVQKDDLSLAITSNLAVVYIRVGELERAVGAYTDVIRLRENTFGPDSPKLAINHQNLAHAYLQLKQYARAQQHFQTAFRLFTAQDSFYMAFPLVGLAKCHLEQGESQRAEAYCSEALAVLNRFGNSGIYLAQTQLVMGKIRLTLGQEAEGRLLVKQAQEILLKTLGPDHPLSREAEKLLGGD